MSTDRERILTRVRRALAPLTERAPLPVWSSDLLHAHDVRSEDLRALFCERLRQTNGESLASPADLAAWLERNGCRHGYCDPQLWPQLRSWFPGSCTVETTFERGRIDEYLFGVTPAAGAIAETGTLILTDGGTSSRLGALAPWAHLAVVYRHQIYADIPAALSAMPDDAYVVWVTGPSKTADIEGILINGVHGPGAQAALLID